MIFQMWNGAWNRLQFKVCQVAHGSVAYLDKHSTLDPVMVSVVSSNPTGGNFLKFLKLFKVNLGLKCKCDLIVKNSSTTVLFTHIIKKINGASHKNPDMDATYKRGFKFVILFWTVTFHLRQEHWP